MASPIHPAVSHVQLNPAAQPVRRPSNSIYSNRMSSNQTCKVKTEIPCHYPDMPASGNTNLYFEAHKPVFFNKNLYFLKTYTNRLPLPHFITRIFITSIVIHVMPHNRLDTYYTVTNTCLNKLWLSLITLHCCLLALCKKVIGQHTLVTGNTSCLPVHFRYQSV